MFLFSELFASLNCAWVLTIVNNCSFLNSLRYLWSKVLKCWLLSVDIQICECDSELNKWHLIQIHFHWKKAYNEMYSYIMTTFNINSSLMVLLFKIIYSSSARLYISAHCHVTAPTPVKRIPSPASLLSDLSTFGQWGEPMWHMPCLSRNF